MNVNSKTGEVIIPRNPFFSPTWSTKGKDYSDDLVEVYELRDFVIPGASGDKDDFTIEKKPVKVDSYHLNKVLQERAKGQDLKSIIARCEKSQDFSILQQKEYQYGDAFKTPSNLSDALDMGVRTSAFIDSLSESQKEEFIRLSKLGKEEFDAYVEGLKAKQAGESKPAESTEGGEK